MTSLRDAPRLRLALLLWIAGMLGVVPLSVIVLPRLIAALPRWLGRDAPPVDPAFLVVAVLVQTAIMLAVAAWIGAALAPVVGLRAPAFQAAVTGGSVARALRPQLMPGLLGGAAGGAVLLLFRRWAPASLAVEREGLETPLLVRVLYGGVTEEVLLRWGVMTLFLWLLWRFLQRSAGTPKTFHVVLAVVASALLFALAHLPAAALWAGELTPVVVAYVLVANSLFGMIAGYLYWRYGLESAIIAHASAHVLSHLAGA